MEEPMHRIILSINDHGDVTLFHNFEADVEVAIQSRDLTTTRLARSKKVSRLPYRVRESELLEEQTWHLVHRAK
jgi:hypothetical protein